MTTEPIINGNELLDKTASYAERLKSVMDDASPETVNPNGWLQTHVEKDNEPSIRTIVKNGCKYERSFSFEGVQADVYRTVNGKECKERICILDFLMLV